MNVQQSRKIKKKCNERNDENKNQNKWEVNEKFENERKFGQRIQVESAERNNNVVIAEKKKSKRFSIKKEKKLLTAFAQSWVRFFFHSPSTGKRRSNPGKVIDKVW